MAPFIPLASGLQWRGTWLIVKQPQASDKEPIVFPRSQPNCPLPGRAGWALAPAGREDEWSGPLPTAHFSMHSPGLLQDQGGCLEAGTVNLCLHFSFQTGHLGRQEPPSSSRPSFPGAVYPAHFGLSLGAMSAKRAGGAHGSPPLHLLAVWPPKSDTLTFPCPP